jgi:hypothetical protein
VNRLGKILDSRLAAQSVALIVKNWALEAGFDPAISCRDPVVSEKSTRPFNAA